MRNILTTNRAGAKRTNHSRALIAVVLACGLGGGAVAVAQTGPFDDLPTLPLPDLSDEGDILQGPLDGETAEDPDAFKALLGFSGPLFDPQIQTGNVAVLDDTLRASDAVQWHVDGLARNQTAGAVGTVTVSATLRAADGTVLDEVSAPSPVHEVRKGEPVPFELRSDVAAKSVASVVYHATGSQSLQLTRSFELVASAERDYGDRQRLTDYPYADPPTAPFPFMEFKSVQNLGSVAVSPTLVGAWLDDGGRVLATAVFRRVTSTGPESNEVVPETGLLASNEASDFVYTNDDPEVAPRLADAEFIYWAGAQTR